MRQLLLIAMILLPAVHAATIAGTIYDLSLNAAEAVVEIDTTPAQRVVARDGAYRFEVPPGQYTLSAVAAAGEGSAEENVTVVGEGWYTIDLFLYPDLSEGEFDTDTAELEAIIADDGQSAIWGIVVVLILLAAALLVRWKRDMPEAASTAQKSDLGEVLAILSAHDGRMTQKELRGKLPHSEAKVSLMLAELEAKGKIEKIKRGRANVLLLRLKP